MMQLVPLQPVASQTLAVILGNQRVRLNVYQRFFGLFVDVLVDEQAIIQGVIAQNLNRIVRYKYLGFAGDFFFADAEGTDNPDYTGLGGRFELLYLTADDLATLGFSA